MPLSSSICGFQGFATLGADAGGLPLRPSRIASRWSSAAVVPPVPLSGLMVFSEVGTAPLPAGRPMLRSELALPCNRRNLPEGVATP